ncbi:GNAT family N-acetyltransferase [Zobellia nedashkovskayae]|uniref:GNAT family N-acetyltransferase n=1 Tax=Zobellia nedashkovskayae TaxID=2779510 RepID=UPI00188C7231|nr:N-acetyltransferase [Zobellia nedashkovskayae]
MQLRLQKCTTADVKLLSKISKQTFSDAFEKDNDAVDFKKYLELAFSHDTLLNQLKNKDSSFYFVYKGVNLTGYFKLNENEAQTDLKSKQYIELERIYVLHDYQSMGIGMWILNESKKIAQDKLKKFLWLGVWEENKKAITFYKKHGFSKFGTHPYYVGNDKQTDWMMRYMIPK